MELESNISKPIIVRKGSKTQNRVNLPVTSSFSIGDEVAVISYTDYLATIEAGADNVTAELEEAKATITELELELSKVKEDNKALLNTNNELLTTINGLKDKIADLNEEVKEEVKAGQLNSNKVATLEERVQGLDKLIASNERAYNNGLDNFIRITESAVKDSEAEMLNKANDVISSAGILKRIRGFTITPEELELKAITSGTIKKLKDSKPVYKLE